MSSSVNTTMVPRVLSVLHHNCLRFHGNLSTAASTPVFSSTAEQGQKKEVEDTDFGAVMYITAVLVFYSLGIVVMIIKYLKTERKEMEEEIALESFFKGIPSKKIEHEREAVNRVAIRAFHTLTSGAKRQDQLLIAAADAKALRSQNDLSDSEALRERSTSSGNDDLDSSGEQSSNFPHRERSKYLPRVSLMFRDSRSSDRRRQMQDNIRGQSLLENHPPPAQESLQSASYHLAENGQTGSCLSKPNEIAEHNYKATKSRAINFRMVTEDPKQNSGRTDCQILQNGDAPHGTGVRFADDERRFGKPIAGFGKMRGRAKGSRPSSQGQCKAADTCPAISDVNRKDHQDPANRCVDGSVDRLKNSTGCSLVSSKDSGSSFKVMGDGALGTVVAETSPVLPESPRCLLVSDV